MQVEPVGPAKLRGNHSEVPLAIEAHPMVGTAIIVGIRKLLPRPVPIAVRIAVPSLFHVEDDFHAAS